MRQYTDLFLKDDKWILEKVRAENKYQQNKWGLQTHSAYEWLTYTAEELGSLAKAIDAYECRNGSRAAVISEAIQVATLALKIAEMYELGGGTDGY